MLGVGLVHCNPAHTGGIEDGKRRKAERLIAKKLSYNVVDALEESTVDDDESALMEIEREIEKFFFFKPSMQKFVLFIM